MVNTLMLKRDLKEIHLLSNRKGQCYVPVLGELVRTGDKAETVRGKRDKK